MAAVVIVAHHERGDAGKFAAATSTWLDERGHEAWMPPGDAGALGLPLLSSDRPASDADLVLSLGGDGTMLRAVRLLDGAPVPLLGVNLGWLGYLTEVESDGLNDALERYLHGREGEDWHIDERLMLASLSRIRLRPGLRALAVGLQGRSAWGRNVGRVYDIDPSDQRLGVLGVARQILREKRKGLGRPIGGDVG